MNLIESYIDDRSSERRGPDRFAMKENRLGLRKNIAEQTTGYRARDTQNHGNTGGGVKAQGKVGAGDGGNRQPKGMVAE